MKLEVLRNKLESKSDIENLEERQETIEYSHKTIQQTAFQFKISNVKCEIKWRNENSDLRLNSNDFICWFDTLEIQKGRLELYDADYSIIALVPPTKESAGILFGTKKQLKDFTRLPDKVVDFIWEGLINGDLEDSDIRAGWDK